MFEKAVELDPGYANAYSAMALSYLVGYIFQFDRDPSVPDHAAELVEKAIALDDSDSDACAVRGWIEALKDQHDRAVADGKRAVSLNPNSAFAWMALAGYQQHTLGIEQTRGSARVCSESDSPRSPSSGELFHVGRYCLQSNGAVRGSGRCLEKK
jgi:tetratricopeptide (TPR) repeat protein